MSNSITRWARGLSSSSLQAELEFEKRQANLLNPSIRTWHQCADKLAEMGYCIIPTHPKSRNAYAKNWNLRVLTDSLALSADYSPGDGLAVATGVNGLAVLDVDTNDYAEIAATLERLNVLPTVGRIGSKGFAAFYRYAGPGQLMSVRAKNYELISWNSARSTREPCAGAITIPPTWYPSINAHYRWYTQATLFTTPINALPVLTDEHVREIFKGSEINNVAPQNISTARIGGETKNGGCDISQTETARQYALAELQRKAQNLALLPKGERNRELHRAVSSLGKWMHHGILACQEIEQSLIYGACRYNGLLDDPDDGLYKCLATMDSGLAASQNDPLPVHFTQPLLFNGATPLIPQLNGTVPSNRIWFQPGQSGKPESRIEILDSLLPGGAGVLTTLSGQSRSGKTFTLAKITACVAAGRPCFGCECLEYPDGVPVVYLAAEGEEQIERRIEIAKEHFSITRHAPIWICKCPGLNLKNQDQFNQISQEIQQYGPFGLMIVDSGSVVCAVDDFNSNAEAIANCNLLKTLGRNCNLPVLATFHMGKDASRGLLGGHQYEAQSDHALAQAVTKDDKGFIIGRRLNLTKDRDGQEKEICGLEIKSIPDGNNRYGKPMTTGVIVKNDAVLNIEPPKTRSGRALRDAFIAASFDQNSDIIKSPCETFVLAVSVEILKNHFFEIYKPENEDVKNLQSTIRAAWNREIKNLKVEDGFAYRNFA